jgi:hypothetical protein
MLDTTQQEKIKRFLADKIMSEAVKKVLREQFLKNHGTRDVQTLAAERLAISMLDMGFKELKKYANKAEQETKKEGNIGL